MFDSTQKLTFEARQPRLKVKGGCVLCVTPELILFSLVNQILLQWCASLLILAVIQGDHVSLYSIFKKSPKLKNQNIKILFNKNVADCHIDYSDNTFFMSLTILDHYGFEDICLSTPDIQSLEKMSLVTADAKQLCTSSCH